MLIELILIVAGLKEYGKEHSKLSIYETKKFVILDLSPKFLDV